LLVGKKRFWVPPRFLVFVPPPPPPPLILPQELLTLATALMGLMDSGAEADETQPQTERSSETPIPIGCQDRVDVGQHAAVRDGSQTNQIQIKPQAKRKQAGWTAACEEGGGGAEAGWAKEDAGVAVRQGGAAVPRRPHRAVRGTCGLGRPRLPRR
jgi:hypothetical protein